VLIIVQPDGESAEALRAAVDPSAEIVGDTSAARKAVELAPDIDVILVGPSVEITQALQLAETLRIRHPVVGVVLVRRRVDSGLLADALRSGIREVVGDRDVPEVGAAVRRAKTLADRIRQQSGVVTDDSVTLGSVVTVFSAKGGCGKTTLATNLAAVLADKGRREVCLVDLDLAFGDVAITLQLFPAHTIADAIPSGEDLDFTALEALLTPHSPGLTTLTAPLEPSVEVPTVVVSRILQLLRRHFQFVVVDTPPAFTDHVLAAFDESDIVALIATLDIPALKNLKLTLETLELLNYPKDRWRVVLNRADSKVGLSLDEVAKNMRVPIAAQIPSSRAVPAAINRGVPIVLDSPNHVVSVSIREFAERHVIPVAKPTSTPALSNLRRDRRSPFRRVKAR
jgi:pilus assembly protein CpaE